MIFFAAMPSFLKDDAVAVVLERALTGFSDNGAKAQQEQTRETL